MSPLIEYVSQYRHRRRTFGWPIFANWAPVRPRDRIGCLCAHGGLTGVPQVTMPGATADGLPVGLSILGGHRTDATLVAVAKAMAAAGATA